jgi:hypothetical protein
MSVQAKRSVGRRGSDAGRGLAALAGGALLVVGVPVALIAWVGWPLPAGVPSPSEVTAALRDTYIPESFLVKALALACWLAWSELVASLAVEAVAYARGRKAGAVPMAGGVQRVAARLVAGVALLGAVVSTRGIPGPADPGHRLLAPVAPPVVLPATGVQGEAAPDDAPGDTAPPPVYEVQRRDTLWDIAERHLGDPFRWQEIFHLNQGRPQPDGRTLVDPDMIHPGWRLELPADATGLAPPGPDRPDRPTESSESGTGLDGGMVLIDDGADGSGGSAVLVTETGRTTTTGSGTGARGSSGHDTAYDPGGMTLLPDGAGPQRGAGQPTTLAGGSSDDHHDGQVAAPRAEQALGAAPGPNANDD